MPGPAAVAVDYLLRNMTRLGGVFLPMLCWFVGRSWLAGLSGTVLNIEDSSGFMLSELRSWKDDRTCTTLDGGDDHIGCVAGVLGS